MECLCSMCVPHFLQAKEMVRFHSVCLENLAQISQDPDLLFHVITVDKLWIHHYNPKTKPETKVWFYCDDSMTKKVRQQKSIGKVILVIFFHRWGMVYQHVSPLKLRISKEYYKMIPERILDHIQWKWQEFLQWWILHQDNAWPHMVALVQEWLEHHEQ